MGFRPRIVASARSLAVSGAAALALGFAGSAAVASTVDSVGDTFDFSWSTLASPYTLTGFGSVLVTAFNPGSITLQISLTNTTNSLQNSSEQVRLISWGFGIDPNATGVEFADNSDAGMVGASLDDIPSLKSIEVCAFAGQNCSGGGNDGIFGDGGNDTFSLTVLSSTNAFTGNVVIDPLGYKYQTNVGSFEFSSTSSGGTPSSTGVPEPSSSALALFGLGLLALGFRARRRSRIE